MTNQINTYVEFKTLPNKEKLDMLQYLADSPDNTLTMRLPNGTTVDSVRAICPDYMYTYPRISSIRDITNIPVELIHDKWKYAAKDDNGDVYIYLEKPIRLRGNWTPARRGRSCMNLTLRLSDKIHIKHPWQSSLIDLDALRAEVDNG